MKLIEDITQIEKNLKANSGKERIQLWYDHFKELGKLYYLLGKQSIPTSNDESTLTIQNKLDIKKGHFTIDALKNSTKSIHNGKAVGLDEIPDEIWKLGEFQEILLNLCNSVYSQEPIDIWNEGCLLNFPKKEFFLSQKKLSWNHTNSNCS